MKKVSNIVDDYRYSLRKRISSTYISIYLMICLIVMIVFVAGYALYSYSKFSSYTPDIAQSIIHKIEVDGSIEPNEFRFFLSSLGGDQNVSEILLYNEQNELLVSTTYANSAVDFYETQDRNVLTSIFPQFSKLDLGYYADQYTDSAVSGGLKIVVYYSLSTFMDEYVFIIKTLALTLTAGLLIFILIGFSRTEQMLRPIAEVTKVAKQINGENLNLRIDEKDARYELKELVQTINKMMDRIQISYNKQKRFVSDVSHELRTPIAVISGYGSMLKRWGKTDPAILDESIDAIINEASNMNDLVEKLLFLARNDNENITFEMDLCDVAKLCGDTVKETMLVHSDYEVQLDIQNQIFAKIDEMRIKQLFRILIDNAVKYSLSRKYIAVSLKAENDGFVFSVKDKGIGISKEDLPNIFDRFYRADESRTKLTGGYGLGLAMAKIIVLGHKGKIHVVSKVDDGSEFSVKIPLNLPQ